ncbi:MAG: LptF/LptG family permease [Saprospiraceae bacterium]
MKKIDKLLITSFIGPFFVSFGIALFVLIMQFLWLYIDEIAGKGVSIFIMLELIGYLSVATFPMALPIAMLIASVMVMGNLAERYELSSMKSAGISLLRVMRSLVFAAAGVAFFSYFCSDFLIPIANLKFKSRLYDIRKQKPALTLEEGVFNEDFRQFVIRIEDKQADGETISGVLIDDQTGTGRLKFNQILADSGQMFTTADKRFFVMNLFRGTQYQEPTPSGQQQKQKYPFVRTNFRSWTKVWDLKEFEMNRTDEDRFATQRSMLTMKQLRQNMDSLYNVVESGKIAIADELLLAVRPKPAPKPAPKPDSAQVKISPTVATQNPQPASPTPRRLTAKTPPAAAKPTPKPNTQQQPNLPKQDLTQPLESYTSFLETFRPEDRGRMVTEGLNRIRGYLTNVESRKITLANRNLEAVKTGYELFTKYSFALVCFIFLFVGAPMGAIIRKGGFGYPILVSIIFFVVFIVLTITCRKLAESYIMSPFWAAMMPCLVLVPIGTFLTRRAMNDAQMFNTDRIDRLTNWLRQRFAKKDNPQIAPTDK